MPPALSSLHPANAASSSLSLRRRNAMASWSSERPRADRRIKYDVPSERWLEEDEYDEYEFHPSISPYALFPVQKPVQSLPPLLENDLLQLPDVQISEDDGIELAEDASTLSPLFSPTYTFASDFVFLNDTTHPSEPAVLLGILGYSKVFTSGLVSKSRKITRQVDQALYRIRIMLRRFKASS